MSTIIYLVKHADELKENGIQNTNDTAQLINEKYILSVKGEEQSKRLSKIPELQNIDVLWSSSYARAKATAKYITYRNNININIDSRLNERKLEEEQKMLQKDFEERFTKKEYEEKE